MKATEYNQEKLAYLHDMGLEVWTPRTNPVITPLKWQLVNRQTNWWILTDEANDDKLMTLLDAILSAVKVPQDEEDVQFGTNESANSSLTDQTLLNIMTEHPIKPACLLVMGATLCRRLFGVGPHENVNHRFLDDCSCPVVLTHALSDLASQPKLKRDTWNAIKNLSR